jgi:lysophospholipase L1-like esterase
MTGMVLRMQQEYGRTLQSAFDAASIQVQPDYWLFDGVHPNAPGQWLIAQAWLDAVKPRPATSPDDWHRENTA